MKLLFTSLLLSIALLSSCKFIDPDSMQRSRFGMGNLELTIPKDAVKILDFDFAKDGNGQTTKYVTYLAKDGEVYTKEYRDGILQFEGKVHWKGASDVVK